MEKADAGSKPNPKPGPKPSSKSNCSILGITYVVVAPFLGLAAYLGYSLQAKSEDVINNSYNARLDSSSDRIARGRILVSNGTVLTQTQMDGGGSETRMYFFGDIFDHAVDYSTKGKTGIEALANFYLLTPHVNLMEQVGNEPTGNKNPGDDVYTTLDTELQQAACVALGARKGVIIAMEPDTGKTLAMVFKPGYGLNSLLGDWEALTAQDNKEGRLLNRVTQGLYPPGSTFKIVTALEYIREHPADYRNYQFGYDSVYENGEHRTKCYHSVAHRHQDFTPTFANSCSGASVSLGPTTDLGKWNGTAGDFLFNGPLPLNGIPYKESAYNMKPGAGTWKILQTSTGQGMTQTTPLHNAMVTAAIVNGGTLMRPYSLSSVASAGDETIKKLMPAAYGSLMSVKEVAGLTELMRAIVTEGTGSTAYMDAYTMAVRTGSAESETGKETHAWSTGFAPAESPRLVVTVLMEEGGSGGKAAAPIARQLFDIYISR